MVLHRRNRGEPIDLYRTGPPPRFTAFFLEFMIFPNGTDHQPKWSIPQHMEKNENPLSKINVRCSHGTKTGVTGCTSSVFIVVGSPELKVSAHRISFSRLFRLYHSRGHIAYNVIPLVRCDSPGQHTEKYSFWWYLTLKERKDTFRCFEI